MEDIIPELVFKVIDGHKGPGKHPSKLLHGKQNNAATVKTNRKENISI